MWNGIVVMFFLHAQLLKLIEIPPRGEFRDMWRIHQTRKWAIGSTRPDRRRGQAMLSIHACPRLDTKGDGDNGGLGLVIIGDSQGRFNHVEA